MFVPREHYRNLPATSTKYNDLFWLQRQKLNTELSALSEPTLSTHGLPDLYLCEFVYNVLQC